MHQQLAWNFLMRWAGWLMDAVAEVALAFWGFLTVLVGSLNVVFVFHFAANHVQDTLGRLADAGVGGVKHLFAQPRPWLLRAARWPGAILAVP